ncbi:MAG: hypothetical protein LBK03_04270 [Bacteroidales bacterium]|jgi:hypothetical protein|nr:hypothetical protein [Bacteroidales bacterium]
MKPIKVTLWIVALVCLAASCKKEPVTYRFAEEDKIKLLPHYIKGKIFTFVNENGKTRKFKVVEFKQYIKLDAVLGGMYGGGEEYFYFEYKRIDMIDLASNNKFRININRYPKDVELARNNIYKSYPSYLIITIGSGYPLSPFNFGIYFNNEYGKSTHVINGTVHENVFVIENEAAQSTEVGMLLDAKTIYYDEYQGLVGFDDINNHQWRLKNSK